MSTLPPEYPSHPAAPAVGTDHDALPPGTRFGEFEIIRVLGVGGFGIVYLANDHSLEREVALKEYMPASLAARGLGPQITVRSSSFAETYAIGLRSFVNEARLLARFDHPSLVKVYRFWEDNATAYMVMPFLQGVTLR
ncbi:MAG: serine/threonine protein kinase, partial [Pseudomonadota bacterium]|nr:serine/threonine protein kinase [Pseudomonadota bacterium]